MIDEFGRLRFLDELEPRVGRVALTYIIRTLEQLGSNFEPGARISLDVLAKHWHLPNHYQRLIRRLCEILELHEILSNDQDGWAVSSTPVLQDLNDIEMAFWDQLAGYQAELTLIRRCGEQLPGIMRGEVDPLEVLFPHGAFATAQWLYRDSPTYRLPNLVIQRALSHVLDRMPQGRCARILELGGGTGGLSSYLTPMLQSYRAQYIFTDVSQVFLTLAQEAFSHMPLVGYRELDLDLDPLAQGFPAHAFDVVVASDVLHATRDLRSSLTHVKSLLAPGGLLLVHEGTPAALWVTLAFGILPSWWTYEDVDLRGSDPRLSELGWHKLLTEEGFVEVESIRDHPCAEKSSQTILLARGPIPTTEAGSVPFVAGPAPSIGARSELVGRWLLFADAAGFAERLAARLAAQGADPVLVLRGGRYEAKTAQRYYIRPDYAEDARALVASVLGEDCTCRGIIYCWNLDTPSPDSLSSVDLDTSVGIGLVSLLHLVQALASLELPSSPQLTVITRGAQPAGDSASVVAPAQTMAWGFGRVIANEQPSFRCRLVDLDPTAPEADIDLLLEEIAVADSEDEVAFRNGCRHVHRLLRMPVSELRTTNTQWHAEQHLLRPDSPASGLLEGLRLRAGRRCTPERGQVEVEVRAAALNFKDLMVAMGTLPAAALEGGYTGGALGVECAGIVTALGEDVTGLAVGDPVIACGPSTLATHAVVDARFVVTKPSHLTFEEASTIPVAFTTAYYALHDLARLSRGERVLIHAASGGVGLAAVQIAQQLGAEIFATAGNEEKRDFLRTIGIRRVTDSRSLAFADDVLAWTQGAGVDVVLNSLSGEAQAVGIGLLAPYGRFVEIGKFDIYANSRLGLRAFRKNLSFFAVDIDRLLAERPDFASSLSNKISRMFHDRQLLPLPHRVFTSARLSDAFRYMAKAKHIGKVVVSFQDAEVSRLAGPTELRPVTIRSNATYLVAGGLGGFGLAVTRWLVEAGARHLCLMGRSGAASDEARCAIETLRHAGAEVRVVQVDVSREEEVRAALGEISQSMPPIHGVLHAAMVLDDGPLTEMTEARIRRVLAPKVHGAWNLHTLTKEFPLEFFVLFSSMSSLIGTPLQSSYAAANAFLDALAWYRRACGLPALAVDWGPLAEVGHLARHPDVARNLETLLGTKAVPPDRYLNVLSELLARNAVQTTVAHLDWPHLASTKFVRNPPRFSLLTAERSDAMDRSASREGWLARLLSAPSQERDSLLEQQMRQEISWVMGVPPEKLNIEQPLLSLGLDSLMAVELKNKVELEFGVEISPMQFVGGITTAQLVALVRDHVEQLTRTDPSAPVKQPSPAVKPSPPASARARRTSPMTPEAAGEVLAAFDNLSDEQVDALLQVELPEE
jgi:NADPH:quinone reductase-like Zn-dependent oxidoreductase/SAM-dependent methyltransferase/acyl carrier protein